MTPEEKLAEKLRRQKLQEESDLRLAMETFGNLYVFFLLLSFTLKRDIASRQKKHIYNVVLRHFELPLNAFVIEQSKEIKIFPE